MSEEIKLPISLSKYYRLPGLHVPLPTKGAFLPAGSVTFVEDGEVEVLPMKASDEMMLKNPDTLMSGQAVEMLFESCIPGIKEPALISAPDMDVLLLAIRVATYGKFMDIETDCPECGKELAFDCNLPNMLQTIKMIPTDAAVRLTDDIVVHLRPYTIRDISKLSRNLFDEERRLQMIDRDEMMTDDQRDIQRRALFKRVAGYKSQMISDSIQKISVPEGDVTDLGEINGFMTNTSAVWTQMIEDKQAELNEGGIDKTLPAKCEHCDHEWRTAVEFDPTTFFGQGSSR